MDSVTTAYLKEQPVVHLLKDYCRTPRSFEQIEHFLAQDCAFDPDKMRERIQIVLRLIDKQFLVADHGDKWRFSIPAAGWAALYGDEDQDAQAPVTLEQFRQFLKFVAVFYELAQNQLCYSAQDSIVTPQGKVMPRALDYSLVEQVKFNTLYQTGVQSGGSLGKALGAQVSVAERDFVRLNMEQVSREQDSHLLLGWPLLVSGQGEERCYTPLFYFALTHANIDEHGAISSPQVIGPFYNAEAFAAKAQALFAERSYGRKIVAGFEAQVTEQLRVPSDALTSLRPLSALVRNFFSEHCYGAELALEPFTRLVGLSEIEHCANKIVFAATLALPQASNFNKSTVKDLKRIAAATDDELRRSALSCFFYDERSAKLRAQEQAAAHNNAPNDELNIPPEREGFNQFAPDSRAALIFNFDPECPCDDDQTQAVRSMLKNDLTVLQGPPGTGKTVTVVNAAFNHLVRDQKVLVTSYNNAAIDAFNDKSLLKVGTGANQETYRLAKLLKDPNTNSALKFKQLAQELVNRPKDLPQGLAAFNTFKTFKTKVRFQEHLIAQLEQLCDRAEYEFNLLQTQVDELAHTFIYRYAPNFPEMPAQLRKLFDLLFDFTPESLQMELAGKTPAPQQIERVRHENLTFNVRFSPDPKAQLAFITELNELKRDLESYQVNYPDDSDRYQHLGSLKRWLVHHLQDSLRYCDHQLVLDLIRAVYQLSHLKAKLVQSKRQFGLANPQLPELNESELEQAIARLSLQRSFKPNEATPDLVQKVDNSVISLLTKLSTQQVVNPQDGTSTQLSPEYSLLEARGILSNMIKLTDADEHLEQYASLILDFFPACTTSLLSVGTSLPCKSAMFDLVIFDEAAQFNFIAALPAMFRAKRAAIIGDPQQLQPVGCYAQSAIDQMAFVFKLSNKLRLRFDLNDTLYDFAKYCYAYRPQEPQGLPSQQSKQGQQGHRARQSHGTLTELILRQNRRSVANIVSYISQSFYRGQLAASRNVDKVKLRQKYKLLRYYDLGFNFEQVPDSLLQARNSSRFSPQEVEATIKVLQNLAQESYQGTIGVIAPFRAQVDELNAKIRACPELNRLDYEIDTVHRFQGKDCDTIIYNLCLDYSAQNNFATNPHIINVALSRARDYLFVVGNPNALALRPHIPYLAALHSHNPHYEPTAHDQELMLAQAQLASLAERRLHFDTKWEETLYRAIKQGMEQDPFFGSKQVGFYTQLPMLHYRLDLALVYQDVGLDIECDGSQHYVYWIDAEHYQEVPGDKERAQRLEQHHPIAFTTMRFRNCLIDQNPQACAQQVLTRFKELIVARDTFNA